MRQRQQFELTIGQLGANRAVRAWSETSDCKFAVAAGELKSCSAATALYARGRAWGKIVQGAFISGGRLRMLSVARREQQHMRRGRACSARGVQ